MTGLVHVLAIPLPGPEQARVTLELPQGATVAEIVAEALPGAVAADLDAVRVHIVSDTDRRLVPPALWPHVRPRDGMQVIIRLVPGDGIVRSVLLAVVSVASAGLAPGLAGIFGITSKIGVGLVGVGLGLVGSALVNALIPVPEPERPPETARSYALTGWRNTARPGEPVPCAFGRHRYAPPYAATPYSEIVGDQQYIRALFCFGYGPLRISDIRIGDTAITDFDDVQYEVREGRPDDAPVAIYPRQVLEEAHNIELVRPLPRDAAGEVVDGSAAETPVIRATAGDAERATVIFGFSSGLFVLDGSNLAAATVSVRIRQRRTDGDPWQEVETIDIVAAKRQAFFRAHSWTLPERGKWQVEITRLTDEQTDPSVSDRLTLSAIQSQRPEYPIALDKPLALVSVRVRASYQLNGQLDNLNALIEREVPDWNGSDWQPGYSRNPASAYAAALQGAHTPFPVADVGLAWEQLEDWHAYCLSKGLKYDRVHDSREGLLDMLKAICAAGRATPRHDGLRWGVVVDRPDVPVVDLIDGTTARDFTWSHPYTTPPDALRVRFPDETRNWEMSERLIPWPGHEGPIDLTEDLALPGKTDPAEIWVAARRRMYEAIHRPDTFSVMQDGAVRTAVRGDLVRACFPILEKTSRATRVRSVTGYQLELDEPVLITEGETYGVRYRVQTGDDADGYPVWQTVTAEIVAAPGETDLVRLEGNPPMPEPSTRVHFGPLGREDMAMKVLGVEAAQGFASRLILVAAAPEIDALTDAEVPQSWTGRVGAVIDLADNPPSIPVVQSVTSQSRFERTDGGNDDGDYYYEPAETDVVIRLAARPQDLVQPDRLKVRHRQQGEAIWDEATTSVTSGSVTLRYVTSTVVEFTVSALLADDTSSAESAIINHQVGGGGSNLPVAIEANTVTVTGDLGHARLFVATPTSWSGGIVLFRTAVGDVFDIDADEVAIRETLVAGTTTEIIDGDATRTSLVAGGEFDEAAVWTVDAGWEIVGGRAVHTPGTTDAISQALTLDAGATYRVAVTLSERTAGTVSVQLSGGSGASSPALSGNTEHLLELVATAGDDTLAITATSAFDGNVEKIVVFRQTAATVPQGQWNYRVAARTTEGLVGPVAGPYPVRIV